MEISDIDMFKDKKSKKRVGFRKPTLSFCFK